MRGVAILAVLAAILFGRAIASPPPAPADDTGYFQRIVKVTRGVWVLSEPSFQVQPIGNVTVIEQRDGLVLVDAGGSAGSGRRIVALVKSISRKPVKAIILSQWHGDKVQGLNELLRVWPRAATIATVWTQAHLADPRTMNTPGTPDPTRNAAFVKSQLDVAAELQGLGARAKLPAQQQGFAATAQMFRQYALDVDGTLTLAPREGFRSLLQIPDPRRPIELRFLGRANTDGDAVVWLPQQALLVTGETVIAPFPYGFGSYPTDWIAVLKQLRRYPFRVLIPGHGPPEHDLRQIDRIIAALEAVEAQVRPLAAQGLTLAQVQAKVDLTASQRSFIGDDPWFALWFKAYWIQPIVESAYKEAKGQPIVQGLTP